MYSIILSQIILYFKKNLSFLSKILKVFLLHIVSLMPNNSVSGEKNTYYDSFQCTKRSIV